LIINLIIFTTRKDNLKCISRLNLFQQNYIIVLYKNEISNITTVGNKRSDVETGLYYNVTRYYDPKIGRFISADDISYLDPESIGGLNLYAYCGNNPVNMIDSEGNFASTILGGLFGGLIGGISAVARGDNFWAGAAHGAVVGAAVGLMVDIAVTTGGIGGLAIAAGGGFAIGTTGDVASQMIFEDKRLSEVDVEHAVVVGGITALTSVAAFGFGSVVNSGVGQSPTGSLFTKLAKSLSTVYTPAGSWAYQAMTGFALSAFSLIQIQ
jgi:RHS repeat-associated protein